MTGRLVVVAAVAALELLVVWGHRLPVVRVAASALATVQRSAGTFASRTLLLLPAAMGVVAAVRAVRRGDLRASEVVLVVLVVLLAVAVVLTTFLLTRV